MKKIMILLTIVILNLSSCKFLGINKHFHFEPSEGDQAQYINEDTALANLHCEGSNFSEDSSTSFSFNLREGLIIPKKINAEVQESSHCNLEVKTNRGVFEFEFNADSSEDQFETIAFDRVNIKSIYMTFYIKEKK